MLEAKANGVSVKAGLGSPEVAKFPACEGEVRKRKWRVGRDEQVFFYRHRKGVGSDCPLRYRPTWWAPLHCRRVDPCYNSFDDSRRDSHYALPTLQSAYAPRQ
jgi:hypothetical protein